MNQLNKVEHYYDYIRELNELPQDEMYHITRYMCRTDLYFLLFWGFGRTDIARQWLLDRCKEVEAEPNGYLDLWAREHYKSTIVTYAKTIQDILASHGNDPLPIWNGIEPTFGLFSCTRPIAKGFLRQIKRELEGNLLLKKLFPDILWESPTKEAPKWSEDDGLIVKRKSNPKESTVEAWGLVEGQPTSKHFFVRNYDDIITLDHVRSPDMIAKVLEAWEMSINLGVDGGIERYVGTRYHFNDPYRIMMARNAATPRIYPATIDGTPTGDPVLLSKEAIAEKRRKLGHYTFSCQMLMNPKADETEGFKMDDVRFFEFSDGSGMNIYIFVDPANEKKKSSDYTVMTVIGLGPDGNYYTLDMIRDRLSLTQRGDALFYLHRKWRPLDVGYEHYGMQADISYIKDRMNRENYRFNITPLKGKVSKEDRIKGLLPKFQEHRWYLPQSLYKTNYEGKTEDLIDVFIHQEFLAFPVAIHDDMLDAMARILDEEFGAIWPMAYEEPREQRYQAYNKKTQSSGWAA